MDHICHQLIGQKLCAGQHYTKICTDLGVSRSLVFQVTKLLDEGQDLTLQPRGGKEQLIRTAAAITIWVAAAENPQHSMRQVTKQHSMDPRTMRNLVKEDMGMESRLIVQRLLLTPDTQEMRKERCQKLLNKVKASQPH
jgi:hypothetical protein